MLVSLYISRIVLKVLGITDFGIYNVVFSVVVMFAFLNSAMSVATQRFLTIEIGRDDYEMEQKAFRTSVTLHLIIAAIFFVLAEAIGVWFLNAKLVIPPERLLSANWTFQFAILSMIISIVGTPYSATVISHEHFNLYVYIGIFDVILRLIMVFSLQLFAADKLVMYSFLIAIITLLIQLTYKIYCNKKFTTTAFSFYWDKKLVSKMSSFIGWNMFGVIAGIGYNQGVNNILNLFFGPGVNAARAVAFQVLSAINQLISNFQSAVNPSITKEYAQGRYSYNLIFSSSKFSYFLLLFFCIPIYFKTDWILKVWLDVVPPHTHEFVRLVIIDVLICSLSGPLQTFVQATGKIRNYQIIVSSIILLNVPISYLVLLKTGEPNYAFIVAIGLSLLALIARLLVLRNMLKFPAWSFTKYVLGRGMLVTLLIIFAVTYFDKIIVNSQLLSFMIFFIINAVGLIILILLVGLSSYEISFLKQYLKEFRMKLKKSRL